MRVVCYPAAAQMLAHSSELVGTFLRHTFDLSNAFLGAVWGHVGLCFGLAHASVFLVCLKVAVRLLLSYSRFVSARVCQPSS